jgi:hypothetical protein
MRMADERGERGVVAAGVEDGFETAGRAVEVFDGPDVGSGGWLMHWD